MVPLHQPLKMFLQLMGRLKRLKHLFQPLLFSFQQWIKRLQRLLKR